MDRRMNPEDMLSKARHSQKTRVHLHEVPPVCRVSWWLPRAAGRVENGDCLAVGMRFPFGAMGGSKLTTVLTAVHFCACIKNMNYKP